MKTRDKFRHLSHLNPIRDEPAANPAKNHHQRNQYRLSTRCTDGCSHRQSHPDDAVPDSALGFFLIRQAAKSEDKQHGSDDICCGDKSFVSMHSLTPLEHGKHSTGHQKTAKDIDRRHEHRQRSQQHDQQTAGDNLQQRADNDDR